MWWREYWWTILITILVLPIAAAGIFAWWLQRQPQANLESGAKCWDAFIKLISALTVVVSGAMLFGKYIDQQERLRASDINLRKAEFLKHKLEFETEHHQRKRALFDEAKKVAAHLAKAETPDHESMNRFDELYLASLIGVEQDNGPVEGAMVRFERKLRSRASAPADSLDQLALQLSTACESELKESQASLLAQHEAIAELVTSRTAGD